MTAYYFVILALVLRVQKLCSLVAIAVGKDHSLKDAVRRNGHAGSLAIRGFLVAIITVKNSVTMVIAHHVHTPASKPVCVEGKSRRGLVPNHHGLVSNLVANRMIVAITCARRIAMKESAVNVLDPIKGIALVGKPCPVSLALKMSRLVQTPAINH